jgi:hypothetical protein
MHGGPTTTKQAATIDISEDTQTSSAVRIGGAKNVAFEWPAVWTGTATVTLLGAHKVTDTFKLISDDQQNALTVAVGVDTFSSLSLDSFEELLKPLEYIKVVAAQAQGADRVIWVHCGY